MTALPLAVKNPNVQTARVLIKAGSLPMDAMIKGLLTSKRSSENLIEVYHLLSGIFKGEYCCPKEYLRNARMKGLHNLANAIQEHEMAPGSLSERYFLQSLIS